MIKKGFFLAGLLLMAFPALAGQGDEGFYTRFDVSRVNGVSDGLKKSFGLQTGVGQAWAGFLRGEFTVEYTRSEMKKPHIWNRSHMSSWAAMGALYLDLFQGRAVSPYLGGGFGVVRNDAPDAVVNGRPVFGDPCFRPAWKAVGGIAVRLPANFVLDIGYTYAGSGSVSVKEAGFPDQKQKIKVRKANIGLRYDF